MFDHSRLQEAKMSSINRNVSKEWINGDMFHQTIIPALLISTMPCFTLVIWFTIVQCDGSYMNTLSVFTEKSVLSGLPHIWGLTKYPSPFIVWTLVIYCIYALVMMKLLPGKKFNGPITQNGNVPEYKDNAVLFFVITMVIFWSLTFLLHPFGFTPSIYYDRFDEIVITLNVFSFVFCVLLYVKGKIAPSSLDSGSSRNVIFDFYWGMELYPRIFGFDVKVFTNCRFGLMIWTLMICIHAIKSYELHGFVDSMFVSAVLQLVYLGKCFTWEAGYMYSLDITMDRAGFYLCWGTMVLVPSLHASVTSYLVSHPVHLGPTVSISLLLLGLASIYVNYQADAQKQKVRKTHGNCLIWGRKPDIIRAWYRLGNGDLVETVLLTSGWWGVSRHFHYVTEVAVSVIWTLPAGLDNLTPWTYVIFLIVLLAHRTERQERKCRLKYGSYWSQYCHKIPYRVVYFFF